MLSSWVSISEYARSNNISDMTVRRRIKSGKLSAVMRDGKYYIDHKSKDKNPASLAQYEKGNESSSHRTILSRNSSLASLQQRQNSASKQVEYRANPKNVNKPKKNYRDLAGGYSDPEPRAHYYSQPSSSGSGN